MALLIRLASVEDAEQITAIYRPFVENSPISFEEIAPTPAEMARRIGGERPGFHPWFVAEEGEKLLGYAASAPFRTRAAYRWIVETGIYLSADACGRGLGKSLLSALLDLLERQHYVAAIGAIALPNPASVALHEKLGFTFAGTYRGVGFKHGQWMDVGLWQRDLSERLQEPVEPIPFSAVLS